MAQAFRSSNRQYLRLNNDGKIWFLVKEQYIVYQINDSNKKKQDIILSISTQKNE